MRLLRETTSLCRACKRSVDARLVTDEQAVFLDKSCPDDTCPAHGPQRALVSSSLAWWQQAMADEPQLLAPRAPLKSVAQGCPFDCGPCEQHEQRVHLPVLPITSSCNLDCPICYTHNKNGADAYMMGDDELGAILRHLELRAPDKRIVNLTGGEPTLHPRLVDVVRQVRAAGFHRVTISTHGLKLAKDEDSVVALKALDARIILSFDSFRPDRNERMLGSPGISGASILQGKLDCLALLEKHDVTTTLLPVLSKGDNDDELGDILRFALERPFVQSVELHPMTFTGQSGASYDRAARYTTPDALADIERATAALPSTMRLRASDFVSSPIAHPLCYVVCYLLQLDDGTWWPFSRFLPRADLRRLLAAGLYLEPGPDVEQVLQDVINRIWAGDLDVERGDDLLATLKRLTSALFSPDLDNDARLRIAERSTKAIYVHTHMDEETFDTDRIRTCCVGMPEADGSSVPSCAYNVLYRERDRRFMRQPEPALVTLGRGRTRSERRA